MKKFVKVIALASVALASAQSYAACTGNVTIRTLMPRAGGWTKIVTNELSDIDIANCGVHSSEGMLLNFNDGYGSAMGKKVMMSMLLQAMATKSKMVLCSLACDTQHRTYSELTHIDFID